MLRLDYYDFDSILRIIKRSAKLLDIHTEEAGAREIARRSRGTPRIANRLRTLVPLDLDAITQSVKKTGRCVVVHEATRTCGFGAELLALVQEPAGSSIRQTEPWGPGPGPWPSSVPPCASCNKWRPPARRPPWRAPRVNSVSISRHGAEAYYALPKSEYPGEGSAR